MNVSGKPVTLANLIGIISVTFGSLAALLAWTLSVSYDALNLAHEALLRAERIGPETYSSRDARNDWEKHSLEHEKLTKQYAQTSGDKIAVTKEKLLRKIETLPRPPKEVATLLSDMSRRLTILEIWVGVQNNPATSKKDIGGRNE